jgi:hypothetical protein
VPDSPAYTRCAGCGQLGIDTVVLEKAENVGGTWLLNRYPGARCDIESDEIDALRWVFA